MKVAIVHFWLVKMAGAEKVIENLVDLYPDADIYTHVYDKSSMSKKINAQTIKTTFINKLPFANKFYKHYLPLMPLALFLLNLKKYDLIICSESGPTKGFRKSKSAISVCYCHSPMRYIWDQESSYKDKFNIIEKIVSSMIFPLMRIWDSYTAKKINFIFSNSRFISSRVKKFWNRKSTVLYPPVDLDNFNISNKPKKYFLVLSRHVAYKRLDLAIHACQKLDLNLKVVGEGPETENLKNISTKSNIEFLGWVNEEQKKELISNCKALIFPGIEDFGIVPIEVMASGRPIIAFNQGGALDYVQDELNGLFFKNQTLESLVDCLKRFDSYDFKPDNIIKSTSKFDSKIFKENFVKNINKLIK